MVCEVVKVFRLGEQNDGLLVVAFRFGNAKDGPGTVLNLIFDRTVMVLKGAYNIISARNTVTEILAISGDIGEAISTS